MEYLRLTVSLPSQQVNILPKIDQYRVSADVKKSLDDAYNNAPHSVFKAAISARTKHDVPNQYTLGKAKIRNLGVLFGPVLEIQDGSAAGGKLVKGAFETVEQFGRKVPNQKVCPAPKWPIWMGSYLSWPLHAALRAGGLSYIAGPMEMGRVANPLRVVISERGRAEIARDPGYYTKVVVPEEKLWEVPGVPADAPLEDRFMPVAEKLDLLDPFDSIIKLADMEEAELESMLEQLFRLNQSMGVTDLHLQNAVLTKDGKFASIDLEPIGGLYDKSQKSRSIRYDRWFASWDPRVFGIIGVRKYETAAGLWGKLILDRRAEVGITGPALEQVEGQIGLDNDAKQRVISGLGGRQEAAKKLEKFAQVVTRVADREVNRLTSQYKVQYAVRYTIRFAVLIGAFKLFRQRQAVMANVHNLWNRVTAPAA